VINDHLADYMAAKGLGVLGDTLFQQEMPAKCVEGLLLLDGYYGTPIDAYLPGYYKHELRLVGRSQKGGRVADLMNRAIALLTVKAEQEIPGLLIKQSIPQNLPRIYKRSVAGYIEMEVDFDMSLVYQP
jgi:hypothetical protein